MSTKFLEIAATMLSLGKGKPEVARMHCDLAAELRRIDKLCRVAGGKLVSRQVIASAIVDWAWRNPDKTPYFD